MGEISGGADSRKNETRTRSIWSDRGARKLELRSCLLFRRERRLWMSYRGEALNPRSIILMSRNANNAQHFQGYVLFLNLFPLTNLRMRILVPKYDTIPFKGSVNEKMLGTVREEFRKRSEKKYEEKCCDAKYSMHTSFMTHAGANIPLNRCFSL